MFPLKNLIHKIHINEIISSMQECLEDNRGGFLTPIEVKLTDEDYERYRHLPVNWSIPPITKEDLPEEFSSKAVRTVDMFRRKTIDLDVECMIYFDIHNGNIIFCSFADDDVPNEVNGMLYPELLKGMHIASIHNHSIQYYSPPSGKNFEMLGHEFEEYELISSQHELWILESKEIVFDEYEINKIRYKTNEMFKSCKDELNYELEYGYDIIDNIDEIYGEMLLTYLNKNFNNVKLTRRYLDE